MPWAGRPGSPWRGRRWLAAGVALILDFVPNHVAPDHPWVVRAPRALRPREPGGSRRTTRRSSSRSAGRVIANGRDPYYRCVAGRRPAQRVLAGPPGRARRHAARHRRPVRRGPLRHGDADDERDLRADLGRAGRRRARRVTTGRRSSPPSGATTRTSASSPRPTGTSSGRSSSRVSTTATTSGFTTASCTTAAEEVRLPPDGRPGYQQRLLRFIENHDEPRAASVLSPERRNGRRRWRR